VLARLIEAALADEEGATLRREISSLRASQPVPVEAPRTRLARVTSRRRE
jgi:hypothetical protein